MAVDKYNQLTKREIESSYKKVNTKDIEHVEDGQKKIVKDLELADRVFVTTKRQAFSTMKDH